MMLDFFAARCYA